MSIDQELRMAHIEADLVRANQHVDVLERAALALTQLVKEQEAELQKYRASPDEVAFKLQQVLQTKEIASAELISSAMMRIRGYEVAISVVTKQLQDVERIRPAARALVDKMFAIHGDPVYMGVWISYANHGGRYTGPKYTEELEALSQVLGSPPIED